jgi:AraC-like DNA-binding protein
MSELMPQILRCGTFELMMTQEAGEAKVYRLWCNSLHLVDYTVTWRSADFDLVAGRPGDVVLTPRATDMSFHSDAPGRHICFHFDLPDPADRARLMPRARVLRPDGEPGEVQRECQAIIQLYHSTDPWHKEAAAWRFRSLLCRLQGLPGVGQDEAAPSRADQAVLEARAWIDANVGEHFTLGDLAARVGLDANYLAARFRERVGRPVMDYRLEKRLQQARHLLSCTNYPQKTIARELGFTDSPHLSHAFRKRFGLSPGRLRATARG